MIIVYNKIYPSTRYEVETWKFPGGEVGVRVLGRLDKNDHLVIQAELKDSDDVMKLFMTIDAIKRLGVASIYLVIPYLPYARQDRVCNKGESLSIKVFADIINSFKLASVTLCDVHSDVSLALFNNVCSLPQHDIHCWDVKALALDAIIAPDAGAYKKAFEVAKASNVPRVITATKHRNTETGEITHTSINEDVQGLRVAVVDDICDGGKTFVELGKILEANGVEEAYLFVTHGIFSKGLTELYSHYNKIYTTNSYRFDMEDSDKFVVNKLFLRKTE